MRVWVWAGEHSRVAKARASNGVHSSHMQDVEKAAAAFAKEAGNYGCPMERPTLEAAKPAQPVLDAAAPKKPVERCALMCTPVTTVFLEFVCIIVVHASQPSGCPWASPKQS